MKADLQTVSPTEVSSDPRRSDEELLLAYRDNGDRDLFAELVQRYEHSLFNYLRRRMGDAEAAEDVFQATFLQVHLKCSQFEAGRSFRPWLYTIAVNLAIDAQRRNRRHELASLDRSQRNDSAEGGKLADLLACGIPGPAEDFQALERREWLQRAIEKLPAGLRDALTLVYYQELKYNEAAEALGVPTGTVKSRVHAAILKLTELWQRDFDETP
jgi:RNA polymerase sigma-70 factor (ECF subfamily)